MFVRNLKIGVCYFLYVFIYFLFLHFTCLALSWLSRNMLLGVMWQFPVTIKLCLISSSYDMLSGSVQYGGLSSQELKAHCYGHVYITWKMAQKWQRGFCWHFGWASELHLQRSQNIILQTAQLPHRLPWKWRQKSSPKRRLKFTNQHGTLQPSATKYSVSTAGSKDKEQIPCVQNSRQIITILKRN
jgi:hypothetical protein